jgi:hypothetical protein
MPKMISQANTNGRNRPRSNAVHNMRSPNPGQLATSNTQSHWQRQYDHYCNLAQATNGDDAVTRERHWQHAEHYLRMMNGSAS